MDTGRDLMFRGKEMKKSIKRELLEWVFTFIICITATLIIKSNVFAMPMVIERSMENTFVEGERVFENKLSYVFNEPKREDIVIIDKYEGSKGILHNTYTDARATLNSILGTCEKRYIIKRIVGIPGDTIDIKEGYVYLNGEKLDESYIKAEGETYAGNVTLPLKVPENKVFVLGDNRNVSIDSRDLGLIDYTQVKSKVLYRIWPLDKIGNVYKK